MVKANSQTMCLTHLTDHGVHQEFSGGSSTESASSLLPRMLSLPFALSNTYFL